MSEITRLYENAGVLEECLSPCYINKTWRKTHDCPNCDNRENYPPFTAEKQLYITKLIGLHYGLKFIMNEGMDYMLSTDLYNNNKFDKQGYGYGFDEAIANLTNNLWQDLSEEEKQQIKEILE